MLFLCISQCIPCSRQWPPQCGEGPGEQLLLPHGDGCPQSMILRHFCGSLGGAGWGLFLWLRYWGFSTCLESLCFFMDVETGLRWALAWWLRWGWHEVGQGIIWTPYLCASVFCSVCAVKLFIPLLNNCIIGMHRKITSFPPHVSFQTRGFHIT